MPNFYTNAITYGDNILVRGYRDGLPFKEKVPEVITILFVVLF